MNCFEKFNCKGACCYDGVYLSEQDKEKIIECVEKYPEEFPEGDYFEISNWKEYRGDLKTKTVPCEHNESSFPKHFNQTKCVFQDDSGKCRLQIVAEQNGEEKWKYKPETCRTFPLRLVKGEILFPIIDIEDEEVCDDYLGFTSQLPCVVKKVKESDKRIYSDEIKYLIDKSTE